MESHEKRIRFQHKIELAYVVVEMLADSTLERVKVWHAECFPSKLKNLEGNVNTKVSFLVFP